MSYLFATKPQPSEPSEEDNFGNLRTTGAHTAIAGGGNGFQTVDATGTPLTSPLAVTTGTTILKVPLNASAVTLSGSAAFSVSENPTIATNFFTVPSGVPITLDVAYQQFVYITTATTANVSFLFAII